MIRCMKTSLSPRTGLAYGNTTQSRPRTPGLVYAIVSALLCVLIAAVALTAERSAPPTIAEFAPQAVEQISDPSDDATAATPGASERESTPGSDATEQETGT